MKSIFSRCGNLLLLIACSVFIMTTATAQPKLRKALDFDGDGKADPTVFRPSNNTWLTLPSGRHGFRSQEFGLANEDFVTPGDWDGDGKADVAVWRATEGKFYWLASSTHTVNAVSFGTPDDEPVARDYDGDGKTDPAVVRRSGGQMYWLYTKSSESYVGSSSVQWGLSTDFVAPGDYDGDGAFDFAVQRPGDTPSSPSTFLIHLSTNGQLDTVPWGIGTDVVVPGDYDGDGKTDIAVVREGATPTSSLTWLIRKSIDGATLSYVFGLTGSDITAQNDYDGDGKCDPAVFRDPTGDFLYRNSRGRPTTVDWGSPSDLPVAVYDMH